MKTDHPAYKTPTKSELAPFLKCLREFRIPPMREKKYVLCRPGGGARAWVTLTGKISNGIKLMFTTDGRRGYTDFDFELPGRTGAANGHEWTIAMLRGLPFFPAA